MVVRPLLALIFAVLVVFVGSRAEAAIAFRDFVYSSGAGTSITGGNPTGSAADDIMIAVLVMPNSASAHASTGGWTQLYSVSGTSEDFVVFWTRRGGSAPNYNFTWTGSVGWVEMSISAWSGAVNTGSPFDATAADTVQNIDPANPNSPALTTTQTNTMVIAIGGIAIGWGSTAAVAGYSLAHGAGGTDVGIAYKTKASIGAEDPPAFTGAPTAGWNNNCVGFTLVLKETSGAPPAVAKSKLKLIEDSTNGSNMTVLASADSISNDVTYTLPAADGASSHMLMTNASGVLSWSSSATQWVPTSKSSNYSILTSDRNIFFLVSGTTTLTLPSPAAVGANYRVGFNNMGSNTVTVQRNASEFINGAVSFTLAVGESVVLITDGTNWYYH